MHHGASVLTRRQCPSLIIATSSVQLVRSRGIRSREVLLPKSPPRERAPRRRVSERVAKQRHTITQMQAQALRRVARATTYMLKRAHLLNQILGEMTTTKGEPRTQLEEGMLILATRRKIDADKADLMTPLYSLCRRLVARDGSASLGIRPSGVRIHGARRKAGDLAQFGQVVSSGRRVQCCV